MPYSIPVKSLDAQVSGAPVNGTAVDQDEIVEYTVYNYIISYGTTCSLGLTLQGSIDGSNWYNMVVADDLSNLAGTNGSTVAGVTGSTIRARYVRARINAEGTSTSATTVTVWLSSKTA